MSKRNAWPWPGDLRTFAPLRGPCFPKWRNTLPTQELARQPTTITAEINEMFEELITWDAATPAEKRAAIHANEKHENR